jgi:hypothetical protein
MLTDGKNLAAQPSVKPTQVASYKGRVNYTRFGYFNTYPAGGGEVVNMIQTEVEG